MNHRLVCAMGLVLGLTVVTAVAALGSEAVGASAAGAISQATEAVRAEAPAEPEAEAPAAAAAQEEEEVPEIAVEVIGKREGLLSISPAPGEAITEVGAQQISDSGAEHIIDAVDLTPSVFIRSQGARYEDRLSIRGAAPRLVLLDGIPIAREGYSGQGGGAGGEETGFAGRILYTLPADIIERIDVIRSTGTIVYGPTAAVGAIINIVTKEPKEGDRTKVSTSYGSYDHERHDIYADVSDGRIGYIVQGGTDYMTSNLALGEKRFTDHFGKLVYNQPDGSKLLIDYFSLDGHRTLDLSADFAIVPARYWWINPWKERFANVVYSKALPREATLDVVYYQRNRDFTTDLFTDATFGVLSQDWLESQDDVGMDLRYSVRHEDGRMIRAGAQWSQISSDTFQGQYVGPTGPLPKPKITMASQDRDTTSLFYQVTQPVRPGTRVDVGVRYDRPSGYGSAFTYAAGLESSISPRSDWHLHIGTGKEHPIPTSGDVQRGTVPPEASTLAAETGITTRPNPDSSLTFNLFWTRTDDANILYNDPPGTIGPFAWVSKAEDMTTSGAEVVYSRNLSPTAYWFANYTYLREDVSNEHKPYIPGPLYPTAPEPPKHMAAAGIADTIKGTRVALTAKYVSDYMALNRLMKTAAPVDAYLVLDLKLAREVGNGQLSLFIENLLDSSYETMPAFPRPGRNYFATYSLSF